jgi:hypothetical protein
MTFKSIREKYRPEELEELIGQRWFSRGWTFQEIILACNPVILCSDRVLPWETFLCGVWGLKELHDDLVRPPEFPDSFYAALALCNIWIHTPRSTHWNGKEIRKDVENSGSFRTYQLRYGALLRKIGEWKMWGFSIGLILGPVQIFIFYHLRDLGIISEYTASWIETLLSYQCYLILLALCIPSFDQLHVRRDPPPDWPHLSSFPYWLPLPITLPGIIHAVRSRIDTDPKDKSYSIYGVLRSLGVPLTRADYAKSQQQIYQELFVDLIKWNARSITLILDAGESGMPNAPSWVPNWYNIANQAWLDPRYYLYTGLQSATESSTPCVATNC